MQRVSDTAQPQPHDQHNPLIIKENIERNVYLKIVATQNMKTLTLKKWDDDDDDAEERNGMLCIHIAGVLSHVHVYSYVQLQSALLMLMWMA